MRRFYLKQKKPLWIFSVGSLWARNAYVKQGCRQITKEEYDRYPEKGKQKRVR